MGRDFVIPGVDPDEPDPYRFHTGRKRDHGGEDAIEIIDLVKQFGRARILNGLNLGLPEDQVSMVLGPSGTGKSVLIKHIVGLLYPDSGDVLVHGESIPNMTDDELFEVRKKFGLLFQDGALFGSMNIYDNTAFPLRQHTDKSEEEIGEIVNRRLKEVGLIEAIYKMPNELSGGMRKRAGFARALVLEPAIVMFDEPDSGPRPGAHGAALRADPRGARRERRLLPGDQPRPQHGAADRRLHRRPLERQNRRVGPERGTVRLRKPIRQPVPQRGRHRPALDGLSADRGLGASAARAGGPGGLGAARARRGAGRATQLPTDAGTDTLVDTDTASYRATQQVREVFGEEPVVVLAEGDLQQLILTSNLGRLLRLEGCLSGKVPKGAEADPGALRRTGRAGPGRVPRRPGDLPQRGGDPDRRTAATGSPRPCRPTELREFLLAGGGAVRDHQRSRASATRNSSPRSSSTCAGRAARRRRGSPTSSPTTTRRRSSCACAPTSAKPNATGRSG